MCYIYTYIHACTCKDTYRLMLCAYKYMSYTWVYMCNTVSYVHSCCSRSAFEQTHV